MMERLDEREKKMIRDIELKMAVSLFTLKKNVSIKNMKD